MKREIQNQHARRVGLARALSKAGYCSRAEGARLIREGRVQLNGMTRRDPETPVRADVDRISVDGAQINKRAMVYLLLNKPRGLITTTSDERGRDTVYACLDDKLPWVAPVGRLDKASEGLLLLTNDSEWAARITDPETHLEKSYHVQISGLAQPDLPAQLMKGVRVDDGSVLRVKRADVLRQTERNTWLAIVLDEGKNRHIRRMLEGLGIEVLRLVRVAIGPLELGELPKGAYRALQATEKTAVDAAMRRAATPAVIKPAPASASTKTPHSRRASK